MVKYSRILASNTNHLTNQFEYECKCFYILFINSNENTNILNSCIRMHSNTNTEYDYSIPAVENQGLLGNVILFCVDIVS